MNTYEKASKVRGAAIRFAGELWNEGSTTEGDLFAAMCECSDEGLAALHDALKGTNEPD